jgi:hypothetical protein
MPKAKSHQSIDAIIFTNTMLTQTNIILCLIYTLLLLHTLTLKATGNHSFFVHYYIHTTPFTHTVEKAKGECKGRSKWKEVISAYPKGKRA